MRFINTYGPQLRVMPQLYQGDMSKRIYDSHAAARDLRRIADSLLAFCYSLRFELPQGVGRLLYLQHWGSTALTEGEEK